MRVAHLSDLHVTDGPRLADHEATLAAILDDAVATAPDLWLVVGDLTGREVPHRAAPRERLVLGAALLRMAQTGPVCVIPGNHDDPTDLAALEQLGGTDELGAATWPVRVLAPGHHAVVTRSGTCNVYALPYPTAKHYLAGERPEGGIAGIRAALSARLDLLLATWDHAIRQRRAAAPDEPHVLAAHVQVEGGRVSERDSGEVLAGTDITVRRFALDGLSVDYGALGHLHMRQEPAHRCWYPSSPWRNDFGETDPKGWHEVEILTARGTPLWRDEHRTDCGEGILYPRTEDRLAVVLDYHPSPCRALLTLDYRWGTVREPVPGQLIGEDGAPLWLLRPSDPAIAACAGAEVRVRLDVSEAHLGSCPWSDEVARVRSIAHRLQIEKRIAPIVRVRAPEIAAAIDPPAKMSAYFGTLAEPVSDPDRAAAIEALAEIGGADDAAIDAATDAIGERS